MYELLQNGDIAPKSQRNRRKCFAVSAKIRQPPPQSGVNSLLRLRLQRQSDPNQRSFNPAHFGHHGTEMGPLLIGAGHVKMTRLSKFKYAAAPLALGLALISAPSFAQDSTDEGADEGESKPIVVTGSLIARPDLTSNSPITVVSGEALQDQGAVNVEEALNQLPQVTPGLNANVNNGGNGTVSVDVRGLGPSRTLVLVNGRRMVPSNNTGVVDLNVINPLLIDRVDVVTGGASATYGSDALGGVVNFVLKKDFEGVELTSQYGVTSRGDSQLFTVGGIVGGNFADNRGNATLAVSYADRSASFQSERAWSRIDQNGGSATGIAGRLDNSFANPFATGGNRAFNADGSVRAFVNNFDLTNPATDRYNFAPVNYIQTPQKRFTITALANYDITDKINFYAEASYVQSEVKLQLAPTPATNIFVNANSPVLSASALALAAGRPNPNAPLTFRRRMVEVGPRIQTFNFDVTQVNVGIKGELFAGWNYDLYYARGRVDSAQGLQNDVSRSRLTSGLNGCPTGSPAGCVVVDAFGPGRISPTAANYIRIASAVDQFAFNRDNIVGVVNGSLGSLPGGDIGAAFGVEYRKDGSDFIPSDPAQRGDLTGFNAVKPIKGSFDTKEVFGEVRLPVVDMLAIDLKGRYSDYSTVGGNFTWSVGGEFKPIDDIRVRATYSQANRAPSVFELFQAGDQGFPAVVDPCFRGQPGGVNPAPSAGVAAICVLQGLPNPTTNVLTQTNAQIEATFTGSTTLREEQADTLTAGIQFTPSFAPGLNLSVDYFDIKVDGYVARIAGGTQGLVSQCFAQNITTAAQLAANPYCSLLTRRPNGDLLATVPLTNELSAGVNNVLKTRGIDFTAAYDLGLGFVGLDNSKLGLSSNVTYLMNYKFNGREIAGTSDGDFGTFAKWKANTRATYSDDNWSLSLNWQYIGKVDDGGTPVKAVSYFDLNSRVSIGDNLELFGGVQNLFDKQPPAITSGFTATNTDETLYDTLGRRFFMGAKVRF
jgi:iron complex outermembrane recepter protein